MEKFEAGHIVQIIGSSFGIEQDVGILGHVKEIENHQTIIQDLWPDLMETHTQSVRGNGIGRSELLVIGKLRIPFVINPDTNNSNNTPNRLDIDNFSINLNEQENGFKRRKQVGEIVQFVQSIQGKNQDPKQGFIGYVTDSNPQHAIVHFLRLDKTLWAVPHADLYPVGQAYIRPKWVKSAEGWEIEDRFRIITQPTQIRTMLENETRLLQDLVQLEAGIHKQLSTFHNIELSLQPLNATHVKLEVKLKPKQNLVNPPEISDCINTFRAAYWNKHYSTQIVLAWV